MERGTATVVQCRDISAVYHSSFRLGALLSELDNLDHNIGPKVSDGVPSKLYSIISWKYKVSEFRRLCGFKSFLFKLFSESWHHYGKRDCAKLEKITERALRLVTRDKSTTRTYKTLLNS